MIFAILMISPLYDNPPTLIASIMKVAAHLEVAFVFCWIIVSDKLNYTTAFVRFLSKKTFITAGKTTYSMYLITPIVVTLICGLTKGGMTFDFPEMVSNYNLVYNCSIEVFDLFIRSSSVTFSSGFRDDLLSYCLFMLKCHFAIYQNSFCRRNVPKKKPNNLETICE